jgi:hypothetical protein
MFRTTDAAQRTPAADEYETHPMAGENVGGIEDKQHGTMQSGTDDRSTATTEQSPTKNSKVSSTAEGFEPPLCNEKLISNQPP